jgi:diphosphomevalonate decarboxylase
MTSVEVTSPTNIALLKYWGKHPRYPGLFIPTKSSISFTISSFFTRTKLTVEKGNGRIDLQLNGRRIMQGAPEFEYVEEFFSRIRSRYPFAKRYSYLLESENNFPTAAGFASSASGFSALALSFAIAMKKSHELRSLPEKQISILARLGSGSAARSIPASGGMVIWHRGYDSAKDPLRVSESSFAESLYPPSHFEDLALICVNAGSRKKVKSRIGMEESVRSVYDYWQWVDYEEKEVLPALLRAADRRNWEALFMLTKQASNNFHSVCLRTSPPLMYLNDVSRRIIEAIHPLSYAAYTFDAGPNGVVIVLKEEARKVNRILGDIVGKNNTVVSSIGRGARAIGVD